MTLIRLPRGEWDINLDQQVDPKGGFGVVYAGSSKENPSLAIKKLNITAGESAHRELRISEHLIDKNHAHINPIYDAGQDAQSDSYYIVMARAERSLRDEIEARKSCEEIDAADILRQIVQGLEEASDIVHRDL